MRCSYAVGASITFDALVAASLIELAPDARASVDAKAGAAITAEVDP